MGRGGAKQRAPLQGQVIAARFLGAEPGDALIVDEDRLAENWARRIPPHDLESLANRWRQRRCHTLPHGCADHFWVGRLLERLRLDGVWSGAPTGLPPLVYYPDPPLPLVPADMHSDSLFCVMRRFDVYQCDTACIDHVWVGRLLRYFFDDSAFGG